MYIVYTWTQVHVYHKQWENNNAFIIYILCTCTSYYRVPIIRQHTRINTHQQQMTDTVIIIAFYHQLQNETIDHTTDKSRDNQRVMLT